MWIEYAASTGPGTLVAHGVHEADDSIPDFHPNDMPAGAIRSFSQFDISKLTDLEAAEFIAIHGSERAV